MIITIKKSIIVVLSNFLTMSNKTSPLVKVKQKYQITIPNEIRQYIPINIGDILETTIENWVILLKPKLITDRNWLTKELDDIFWNIPNIKSSEDEVMDEVISDIKSYRKKKSKSWK